MDGAAAPHANSSQGPRADGDSAAHETPSATPLVTEMAASPPREDAQPSSHSRRKYPEQIHLLVNKAFADFKRVSLASERSKDYLGKLNNFKSIGSLPKNLMVKPPKLSINDDESNALLSAKLETIQADANKLFLDAYIDVVS